MLEYESVISYLIRKIVMIIDKNNEKGDVIPKEGMKGKWIKIGLPMLGLIVTLLGVQFFDITIFEGQRPQVDMPKEPEPLTSSQINWKKESEQETLPQHIRGTELSLSLLIKILKDLPSYSYRLEFIEDNMNLMPESLSLREMNSIFNLFRYSSEYKLKILKLFLSRLQDNYSHSDFERFKRHYSSGSYRLEAINLIIRKK